MANIFEGRKEYGAKWDIVNTRRFSEEELAMVESATIEECNYGLCAKCLMVNGKVKYLNLGKFSNGNIGEKVNLKDARIITMERDGAICEKIEF